MSDSGLLEIDASTAIAVLAALAALLLLLALMRRPSRRKGDLRGSASDPAPVAAAGPGTDALERKVRWLESEKRELTAVLAILLDDAILLDSDDRITHVGSVAADLLGIAKPAGQRPLWEALRDPGVLEAVAGARKKGVPVRTMVEQGHPLPRRRAEVTALPILSTKADEGTAVVLKVRDLTERYQIDEMRRDFVANVSHEMKTPLTTIQGYVETLIDGGIEDRENAIEFLSKVHRQSLRLSHLVGDLIVLSRVESGALDIAEEPFEADHVLLEAVEDVKDAAAKKNLEIVVSDPVRALLRGDRSLLVLAIANLLENAVQYTPDGGRIEVKGETRGRDYAFVVADTGIGIPEGDLRRIFERFYRVDKARSRAVGGTGLGLSIVKHVAREHGGDVGVESCLGAGSVFTLTVPRLPDGTEDTPSGT